MLAAIKRMTLVLSVKMGAQFVPAGELWDDMLRKKPDTFLWEEDSHHPAPAGTYLAALGIYHALTGRSADDVTRFPPAIKSDEALILRRTTSMLP